jgi:hypothetical protein
MLCGVLIPECAYCTLTNSHIFCKGNYERDWNVVSLKKSELVNSIKEVIINDETSKLQYIISSKDYREHVGIFCAVEKGD